MSSNTTDSWIGAELDGRYVIESLLGMGGMGSAYLAQDSRLNTSVVIKVPNVALLSEAGFGERFAREVRSLVDLEHPFIVKIGDVGDRDGVPYLVMSYLAGGSLESRRRKSDGKPIRLSPEEIQGWLPRVAEALDFIHSQGYIHRDVKPANILFDRHGHVYLSDFGIAKAVGRQVETQHSLTGTGVIGTPAYMAPELLIGKDYDGRCDQYSLAVVVFELLAARRPFDATMLGAIIAQHLNDDPPPLTSICSDVPVRLSEVVMRGLRREPSERFENCLAFATQIVDAVAASAGRSPKTPTVVELPAAGHSAGTMLETPVDHNTVLDNYQRDRMPPALPTARARGRQNVASPSHGNARGQGSSVGRFGLLVVFLLLFAAAVFGIATNWNAVGKQLGLISSPSAREKDEPNGQHPRVYGTVTLQNRPVSGAKIDFVRLDDSSTTTAYSQRDGKFELRLPPGDYRIEVFDAYGMQAVSRWQVIRFTVKKDVVNRLNIFLKPKADGNDEP